MPIWFIVWITGMFIWLLYETDWLRINLMVQQATISESQQAEKRKWQFDKYGDDCIILCRQCYEGCSNRRHYANEDGRWYGWKIPARTIIMFNSTLNFVEGCNFQRAKLLKDIIRAQKRKRFTTKQAPLPIFIERIRIGSHWKRERWTDAQGKKHQCNTIIDDYETQFHNCLIDKKWLKKHHADIVPESTIELSVDGNQVASFNGDYKRGTIKNILKPYITKSRIGRKTFNIPVGEADRIA